MFQKGAVSCWVQGGTPDFPNLPVKRRQAPTSDWRGFPSADKAGGGLSAGFDVRNARSVSDDGSRAP